MMWTKKHEPENLKDLVISEDTKKRFVKFVENYDREKKKALLLWGEVGVGKTLLPITHAKEKSYDITELNASSERSKKVIESSLKNIVTTASLFGNKKIVLIDEVDCMGRSDRGGLQAVIDAIKITRFPVILTAGDYWDSKISALRKHVLGLEVKPADRNSRMEFVKQILETEGTPYEEEALKRMIDGPDVRAIINDAQTLHHAGGITVKNLETVGYRNKKKELKTVIHSVLTAPGFSEALKELNNSDSELREITQWISENIAYYGGGAGDYKRLSEADVFGGRIIRRQYWRLQYYQRALIASINSLEGVNVKYPEIFKKMFITRSRRARKESISQKLGAELHASKHKTSKYYLNWLGKLGRKELEQLELDDEEINYLLTNQ